MVSPFQPLPCLSMGRTHCLRGTPTDLNRGVRARDFPEAREERVVVDYLSGEAFTGFQYLRHFKLFTGSGNQVPSQAQRQPENT